MAKFVKIGNVIRNKHGKEALALGDNRNRDPKYNFSVEVIVRDNEGKEVHRQKDGFLNFHDPRKNPNITPERLAKLPEALFREVTAVAASEDES